MKKLRKAVLIILVLALVIGLACVVAGYLLGAQPLEIAKEIYEGLIARINPEKFAFIPQLIQKPQTSAAPLA